MSTQVNEPQPMTREPTLRPDLQRPAWMPSAVQQLHDELLAHLEEPAATRLRRGLEWVSGLWRQEDGSEEEFRTFIRANFAAEDTTRDAIFQRLEAVLEQMDGHMHEIRRILREPVDLDMGPLLPLDETLAGYEVSAHVSDDLFRNKVAFVALLNFPPRTLPEKLSTGELWSRREWAEARLGERFAKRVPAEVNQAIAEAVSTADQYVSEYNIWMHHVLDGRGQRLFPPGMRLLSHWNLRDQIKAEYVQPDGLPRQRMLQQIMERIVTQTIPQSVVNNPQVDWNLDTNDVVPAAVRDTEFVPGGALRVSRDPEPDTRYRLLLDVFRAMRLEDPYSPLAPTHIARRFDEDRQIPEDRFAAMLREVLASPLRPRVAALIEKRLGRRLEPFDIWYSEFRPRSRYTEPELDAIVRQRYPTAEAYRRDIPNLLRRLGFSPEQADYLAENIVVDAARGAGHAMGARMRGAKAHLRTRVDKNGMTYKGFNVAAHELGHNVEQVYSLNKIDHYLLEGVPNTAFTEAFAFVFQNRDLRLLDLDVNSNEAEPLRMLNAFWQTYEIAGVALVDMEVWHWMYEHPEATAADLKEATLYIARNLWNQYYAPIFGVEDVVLLAVYSHMIDCYLYLPDYPLGHMIAIQLEQHLSRRGTDFGAEVERIARYGNVTPDLWMKHATGNTVGPEALLQATERALSAVQ
jgi:hypothetical protein